MPGYRAGSGGGLFGSSAYADSRPKVDVGGALDALGNTATSLVQQAYQRKVNQQELALRTNQADLEKQRFAGETDFRNRTLTFQQQQHADELKLRQQDAERQNAASIAALLPQGYAFDDDTPLTSSAYASAAAPTTTAPAAAPPPVSSAIAGSPAYRSQLESAYAAPSPAQSPTQAGAPAAAPDAAPARSANNSVTIGGRRLVYKGYDASATAQQDKQRLANEMTKEAQQAKDHESLARLTSNLEFAKEKGLIPLKEAAAVHEAIAKMQATLPKTEEMRIAGLMPELVSSVKNIDAYDAPNLVTKLGSKGTFGNFVVSPEGQQFNQSADQFLQAMAFARSGKRINDAEIQRMRDAYIPKAGDSDEVLAKKRAARQQAINGVLTGAGRGANFVPPEDMEYLRGKGYAPAAAAATPPPGSGDAPGNIDLNTATDSTKQKRVVRPGAGGTSLPKLTPEQTQRASTDPAYKQFLTTKGYRF